MPHFSIEDIEHNRLREAIKNLDSEIEQLQKRKYGLVFKLEESIQRAKKDLKQHIKNQMIKLLWAIFVIAFIFLVSYLVEIEKKLKKVKHERDSLKVEALLYKNRYNSCFENSTYESFRKITSHNRRK